MLSLISGGNGSMPVDFHHRPGGLEDLENQTIAPSGGWHIPILRAVAVRGEGINEVTQAIRAHLQFMRSSGLMIRNQNNHIKHNFEYLIREKLFSKWFEDLDPKLYELY